MPLARAWHNRCSTSGHKGTLGSHITHDCVLSRSGSAVRGQFASRTRKKTRMQKKEFSSRWQWIATVVMTFALAFSASATDPSKYGIRMSATVSTSPAQVNLVWVLDPLATAYH